MILCPYCHNEIDDNLIASHLGRIRGLKGGAKGGSSKSKAKTDAARVNMKKAQEVRAAARRKVNRP